MTFNSPKIGQAASPVLHLTAWVIVFMLISAIVGSYFAKTEIAAQGNGKVVPSKRIQDIHALINGKIKTIFVDDGDRVNKGDKLVEIQTVKQKIELRRLVSKKNKQLTDLARLEIEQLMLIDVLNGELSKLASYLSTLEDKLNGDSQFSKQAKKLIKSKFSQLTGAMVKKQRQLDEVASLSKVFESELESLIVSNKLHGGKLSSLKKLLEKGAISKLKYIDEKIAGLANDGQIIILKTKIEETIAKRSLLMASGDAEFLNQENALANEIDGIINEIYQTQSNIEKQNFEINNAIIYASLDGTVENLSVHTIGGLVGSGDLMLNITPLSGGVDFVALFDNQSIGFLKAGQKALVRFDAYPSTRYGYFTGSVSEVSSDATEEINGKWLYSVKIKLHENFIMIGNKKLDLVSGMTASVDVVTGSRRLISYFFEPVLIAIEGGLRER